MRGFKLMLLLMALLPALAVADDTKAKTAPAQEQAAKPLHGARLTPSKGGVGIKLKNQGQPQTSRELIRVKGGVVYRCKIDESGTEECKLKEPKN